MLNAADALPLLYGDAAAMLELRDGCAVFLGELFFEQFCVGLVQIDECCLGCSLCDLTQTAAGGLEHLVQRTRALLREDNARERAAVPALLANLGEHDDTHTRDG